MQRNVFVTGGTGYLGRALIERLVARGHAVTALARPGSEARLPRGARTVLGAALARTLGVLVAPAHHGTWIAAAGLLWALAFGLYFVAYLPVCANARVDGKAG